MSVSLICLGGLELKIVGGGWSLVGGVILELDGKRLKLDHREDES